jgi:hypothetical protein
MCDKCAELDGRIEHFAGSPPLSLINLRLAGSRNWWRNSKRKKPSYTQSNRSKAGLSWLPLSYQGQGCDVPYWRPAQPVDATQALNLSAGVSNCKVSRGRSLS